MNVQHMSRSDSWQTPDFILSRVHTVLGNIDLDPASDLGANQRVGARQFYTREQDGLATDWISGSIFLNPPGGKKGNESLSALFWCRLMKHKQDGKLSHAIFMAFSVEQLAVTQGYGCPALGDFTLVVPKQRIAFLRPDGTPGEAPSHSNCIAYVPGKVDLTHQFISVFGELGTILNQPRP